MAVLKYLFFVMAGLTCLECTQLTAINTPQTFETLGYSFGMPYLSNMYQTWNIKTKDSSKIIEVVFDMDIESGLGCMYDRLIIYDGSNTAEETLGTYCGTSSGNTVISSDREMLVVFRSDYSVQHRGFKLRYRQVTKSNHAWMIVGIVFGVSITILSICLILLLCGVCKAKNQIASVRVHYGRHQQPIWMVQRSQNHIHEASALYIPPPAAQYTQPSAAQYTAPPAYEKAIHQNQQAMEMQDMNRRIPSETSDNTMPTATSDSLIVNSIPPRQH